MKFKYEITKKNEVKVWDLENPNEKNAPFLAQPNWPDGTAWKDKAEAEAWIELFIESMQNPESEFIPGTSPDNHPRPRPKLIEFDPETGNPIVSSEAD